MVHGVSPAGISLPNPLAIKGRRSRVPIDFLEIVQIVVSDITDFRRHLAAELVLDTEVPLLRVGVAEVGPELQFRGRAGISLGAKGNSAAAMLVPSTVATLGNAALPVPAALGMSARLVKGEVPCTLVARL